MLPVSSPGIQILHRTFATEDDSYLDESFEHSKLDDAIIEGSDDDFEESDSTMEDDSAEEDTRVKD